MARLIKIKEFHESTFHGPQSNRHVWMEIREGWYERQGTETGHNLERAYGGKPYPALICGCRNGLCKLGYEGVVGQVMVAGGYESWFQVANYNRCGYNVKWRLWTKKPDEEQRKNTPWDVNTIS